MRSKNQSRDLKNCKYINFVGFFFQIASRALSVPLSKIYIAENSTNTVANANATAGSCTTDVVGAAVLVRLHP